MTYFWLISCFIILYIIILMLYGLSGITHSLWRKAPVDLIVLVYSFIIFVLMQEVFLGYKFDVLETSNLISSKILTVFFVGVYLSSFFESYTYGERTIIQDLYFGVTRSVPKMLVTQNWFWYLGKQLFFSNELGIIFNILFWVLLVLFDDATHKRLNRNTYIRMLRDICILASAGCLYLLSGNVVLASLVEVFCMVVSSWMKKGRNRS